MTGTTYPQTIVFLLTRDCDHFIAFARGREDAKRQAAPVLRGDPEKYTVTPLTQRGDRVSIGTMRSMLVATL